MNLSENSGLNPKQVATNSKWGYLRFKYSNNISYSNTITERLVRAEPNQQPSQVSWDLVVTCH